MRPVEINRGVFIVGLMLMGISLFMAGYTLITSPPAPPVQIDTGVAQAVFDSCMKTAPVVKGALDPSGDYTAIVEQCTATSRKLAQKN
ncbi:MAG TPA: hypothetical protein VN081_04710 [Dongiaceae bacterium]|nr:hypothetical protein [Dongiaceae bacterium]